MFRFALLALVLLPPSPRDEADAVYKNGNLYTVTRGRAEAMAIKGDRILAVGSWAAR